MATDSSSAPPRRRRTHAERTAETRARILAAVVESLADVGFQGTTSAEIARRAGVTWGAVQHHFGGKDGIFAAVLEDSFAHFAEQLLGLDAERVPLGERVSRFIDRAWNHFGSDRYRSTFEILVNQASGAAEDPESTWQREMFRAWDRTWQGVFADTRLSRQETTALQQYTLAMLTGLASLKMLEGKRPRDRAEELGLLKQSLLHAFEEGANDSEEEST